MENPDISEKDLEDALSEKDVKLFFEISRENRLNYLFENLNIDKKINSKTLEKK